MLLLLHKIKNMKQKITNLLRQIILLCCLGMLSQNTFAQLSLQAGWAIIATPYDEKGYGMDFDQGGYNTYICGEAVNATGTSYDAIYRGLNYATGWDHTKTFVGTGASEKALFVKSYISGPTEKILSIGHFSGTATYGNIAGQTLTSNFGNAIYLSSNVKNTGANFWLASIIPTTASASVFLTDFYYDATGGFFYLTGTIENNVSFSGTIVNGGERKGIFFAKYDLFGNLQWAKAISSPNVYNAGYVARTQGGSICADASGNVYVSAFLGNDNNWDVDPNAGTTNIFTDALPSGFDNMFIGKYSSTGNLLNYITWGGSGLFSASIPKITKLKVSGNNLIAAGNVQNSTPDFNPLGTPKTITTTQDALFAASYNTTNLNCNWVTGATSTAGLQSKITDLQIAPDFSIYLAGYFAGNISFPGLVTNVSSDGKDMLVARFWSNGAPSFASSWGGPGDDGINSMLLGNGAVYINGYCSSNFDFDPSAGSTVWPGQGGTDWVSAVYSQNIPLPVNWNSFTAELNKNNQTNLTWSTSAEKNTLSFEVEKCSDAKTWTSIYKQAAAGNSESINTYSAVDANVEFGTTYYRIKQIDIDHNFTYSTVEKVSRVHSSEFVMYPNPVSNTLYISLTSVSENSMFEIYTIDGRKISVEKINSLKNKINVETLAKGTYMIKIYNQDQILTSKFVRQ
jgi:hypothetical protein